MHIMHDSQTFTLHIVPGIRDKTWGAEEIKVLVNRVINNNHFSKAKLFEY